MEDPRENFVRAQMTKLAASLLAGCRPIAHALSEEQGSVAEPLRSNIQSWIQALHRAERKQSVTELHSESEFRIRIEVATALQGAADFFLDRRPRIPQMLIPPLAMAVIFSGHLRLQTQAALNRSDHDQEAAALCVEINRLIAATGMTVNPLTRMLKGESSIQMANWLEASPERYDRALAPVFRALALQLSRGG